MNSRLKFSIGILFVLTILFCKGINGYSTSVIQPHGNHLSSQSNSCCNNLSADIDSFDDDQIIHVVEITAFAEIEPQKTITPNCFVTQKFIISIWQPPKLYRDIL